MKEKGQVRLWFEDFWHPPTEENIRKNSLYRLLARHWDIVLSPQNPDFLLYSCFGNGHMKYDCIHIYFTGENIRPDFERCDYAFSFDYPQTERSYRLPLYRLFHTYQQLLQPRGTDGNVPNRKKFCCFLASNLAAHERIAFFDLLSKYKTVDSGGAVRNNIGYRVTDKAAWLKDYKFCIAFENSSRPGYTSEKLPDALVANTIPIYWGDPEVAKDFNPKAFVNCRDYASLEDVVEVVRRIDQDDALYREYLGQPCFPGGIENESCREENIIARFHHVFTEGTEFVPRRAKRRQNNVFRALRTRHLLGRTIEPARGYLKKLLAGNPSKAGLNDDRRPTKD